MPSFTYDALRKVSELVGKVVARNILSRCSTLSQEFEFYKVVKITSNGAVMVMPYERHVVEQKATKNGSVTVVMAKKPEKGKVKKLARRGLFAIVNIDGHILEVRSDEM